MTTEIAVANRLGIALASDSAVTITGGGRVKVFDTADKLFELSLSHPIGVMINGNMDCLGVPWEIMVKEFREGEGNTQRSTVEQWTTDFLAYVESHALIGGNSTDEYIRYIIEAEIRVVQENVTRRVWADIAGRARTKASNGPKSTKEVFDYYIQAEITERKEFLLLHTVADSLYKLDRNDVVGIYGSTIKSRIVEAFKPHPLQSQSIEDLQETIIESLLRTASSIYAAGVVVAGFGGNDPFPSVHAVEVDGRVAGKLKYTKIDSKSIMTSAEGGQVTYFAQTDVIQRLLEGADPKFIDTTADFIEEAIKKAAEGIDKVIQPRKLSKKRQADREKLIQEIADVIRQEYEDVTAENLKREFSRAFDAMIAMMPKPELIELAEALVSITAVERKATSDEGTVGGLIDVAFITKHEGFVWIKRKHYFEKDLNPTYFWRRYKTSPIGSMQ